MKLVVNDLNFFYSLLSELTYYSVKVVCRLLNLHIPQVHIIIIYSNARFVKGLVYYEYLNSYSQTAIK